MLSKKPIHGAFWFAVLSALAGCQSALGGGVDAYHHAEYPRAARELRAANLGGIAVDERPRYELYAGLTQLALGDARQASEHLTRARLTFERSPGYYSREECARLLSAWRALGRMPGQPLAAEEPRFPAD